MEDDSLLELTLIVKDGDNGATLALTEEERQRVALEGLSVILPW